MPSRADCMLLLARVESARVNGRRSELVAATDALRAAADELDMAKDRHDRARAERRSSLARCYTEALGRRTQLDILRLHTIEQSLASRQNDARQAEAKAQAAQRAAEEVQMRAQNAMREASMRAVRRGRMADTLRQNERLAAMISEEELLADELMERISASVSG